MFTKRLERKPLKRYQAAKIIGVLLIVYGAVMIYHVYKPVPEGISYKGKEHTGTEAEVLFDLTYEKEGSIQREQAIFDKVFQMIEEADEFIVIDMFLFNEEYPGGLEFPELSGALADKLIQKKQAEPELTVIFITDRINSVYGSRTPAHIKQMEEAGITVIWTDLKPLRDSNPIYSGFWRTAVQWFGTPEGGRLPSPFSETSDPVTLRSYLDLLNFKANHRKTVITGQKALVTSANPHDASAYHSNIAFIFQGEMVKDLLKSERAAAEMSGIDPVVFESLEDRIKPQDSEGGPAGQILTEKQIKYQLLKDLSAAGADDNVWIGMFYVADRDVMQELKEAGQREVNVRLILDVNQDAFGRGKIGIPNRPAADELVNSSEHIKVKWYRSHGEQYHTKVMYIENGEEAVINGGSSNYTRRNLDNFNLESNVVFRGSVDDPLMTEMEEYFHKLWNNEEGLYTDEYEAHQEDTAWKYWLYRFQEATGMSSF